MLLSLTSCQFSNCNFVLQLAKEPSNSVPSTPLDPNKRFLPPGANNDSINGQSFITEDGSFIDDDFDDTFDEAFDEEVIHYDDVSLTASDNSRVYPVSCAVLYGYTVSVNFYGILSTALVYWK